MANRALIAETYAAVGSLVLGKPYRVHNEEVYNNLTATQVTNLINSRYVNGVHNVNSDIVNGLGLHDVVLHQIRMYNAADVGSRLSWAAITAAETQIQTDNTTATTKQLAIYNGYLTTVNPYIGTVISSANAPQMANLSAFNIYMRSNAVITDGKGKILGYKPVSFAPIEYHYNLVYDNNDWLVCTLNPNWASFIV